MANSLPWSVKGVDPRTRDAAKAAARRAGMTLGEWLDHKIRDESEEGEDGTESEQLDIAALSERLARLSQGQMDTSSQATASARPAEPNLSRQQVEAALSQAALAERMTRESSTRTAGALDSIARWMENTEHRLASGERAAAERQERATTVIADAIKTMGERLSDIERRSQESQRAPRQAVAGGRPVLSRNGLAAAVTDIRTRQRLLDSDIEAMPARGAAVPESRIAALREDLRSLSAKVAPANDGYHREAAPLPGREIGRTREAAASREALPVRETAGMREADLAPLHSMISDLGARIDQLDRRERLDPVLKPLARIESEVARLSQDRSQESFGRFELEVAHLAAKVDALAARGGDRAALAPVLRDIGELREMMLSSAVDGRLVELSRQVSTLSEEVGRVRDTSTDGRDLRSLSLAIEDVRDAILSDRTHDRHGDPSQLMALSRQIEQLAGKIDTLPALKPEILNSQADQLAARLESHGGLSDAVADRIETLIGHLEAMAERKPDQLGERIDALQRQIEQLATQGPVAVTRQIEALAGRIESLAASSHLSQLVSDDGGAAVARVDMRPVEEMLRNLAEKIDEAGRPGAETGSFDALEQQIAGLATRLDEAAATRSAQTGIEHTLQDLVRHLGSLREDTAAAAERAARAAMADSNPNRGLSELSSLVTGLRDTHMSSGRETQDAIGAVHQTLETVISRLASLEAELGLAGERRVESRPEIRPVMPPRAAASRPPAMPAATGLDAAVAISPMREDRIAVHSPQAAEAAFDLPLEPGSGRPRAEVSAAGDQQSIRQNLIAAARRSAKAATDAAGPAASTPDAGKPAQASGGRLKEIMEKRRRPLLLGLAAIVLAMGTAHVVTGALTGAKTKPIVSETLQKPADIEESKIETSIAAPEAPAKPVKDQTSALAPAMLSPDTANAAPVMTLPTAPESTGATAKAPVEVASLPPATNSEPVQPVTGLGEIPTALGSAGLRKAALAGDARAVYELASKAADSTGAQRDPKLALRLFERAAVAGLAPAQFRVGNMFEKGIGTARDPGLARVWYNRAAERGNAKAMHNLAVLYAEGVSGKPDYAMATEWFRRAAEFGVRDSQYNLAVLLGRGLGTAADLGQSYQWFAIAAGQGDGDAGKKRDEVAGRLDAGQLAAAKQLVQGWKAKPVDPAANEVAAPAKGWDEVPAAAAKKPAKPGRG